MLKTIAIYLAVALIGWILGDTLFTKVPFLKDLKGGSGKTTDADDKQPSE
jgi:hypothetical protein